ncbi:MAG: nucleotide exchange factor GrpE [Tissierellia bacterium]|nr:nucleotide exchange factor GrpE [Tissierellia bacterium]
MSKDKKKENLEEEAVEEKTEDESQQVDDSDISKEVDELTVKLARLQADFINYKKRSEVEKARSMAYGIETFVCELLPILDNFQRALESEVDKETSFYKGVEMILNQLTTLLENKGIEEIPDLGMDFDPNIHNAISMQESNEIEAGKVISVLEKGYKFKDKVIRPSMVIVSK